MSTAPAAPAASVRWVSNRVGRTGINLFDTSLIPLVQHELAYREVGALIYFERLWTNLLPSQALTFSLFGPFKQNLGLATAVMRRLATDLVGEVTDVRFEHSPGRGHPRFTADHTAFDVLLRGTTPQGRSAFVAIEVKYSEAPAGVASPARPRYDALSRETGVYRDPDAPALRYAPIEQLWREQLLVTAMLKAGDYDDGRPLVKQALELGGNVRKGERGELVVYANRLTRTETDDNGEQTARRSPS